MSNIQPVFTNHISYITSYVCMFQLLATQAMIFLPTELPYELSRDMFASSARSMRLYVKRVFINDKFEDLVRVISNVLVC